MRIRVSLGGAQDVKLRRSQMLSAARDMTPALERAGALTRNAGVERIRAEGPGWQPNQRGGHTGILSGEMMRSITANVVSPTRAEVGEDLKYAAFFQHGTGRYVGHQSWVVTGKGKALSWNSGGKKVFAKSVTISGQPPRPFLGFDGPDDPLVSKINETFARHLLGR